MIFVIKISLVVCFVFIFLVDSYVSLLVIKKNILKHFSDISGMAGGRGVEALVYVSVQKTILAVEFTQLFGGVLLPFLSIIGSFQT